MHLVQSPYVLTASAPFGPDAERERLRHEGHEASRLSALPVVEIFGCLFGNLLFGSGSLSVLHDAVDHHETQNTCADEPKRHWNVRGCFDGLPLRCQLARKENGPHQNGRKFCCRSSS